MEVGKKYIHIEGDGNIIECTYVAHGNIFAVMKNLYNHLEYVVYQSLYHRYKEYKEPRTLKRWMVVYEDKSGKIFSVTCVQEGSNSILNEAREKKTYMGAYKVLDIVEINWVEKSS